MKRFEKMMRGWYIWKKRISASLACIVVFVTVYAMVLPAITLDQNGADQEEGINLDMEDSGQESEPEEASGRGEEAGIPEISGDPEVIEDELSEADHWSLTLTWPEVLSEEAEERRPAEENETEDPEVAEEPDYSVTASFDETAGLPADVRLQVDEIEKDSDQYKEYCEKALKAVRQEGGEGAVLRYARFFDIAFLTDEGEVEPTGTGPVNIVIDYKEEKASDTEADTETETETKAGPGAEAEPEAAPADELNVVHFDQTDPDEPKIMEIVTEEKDEQVTSVAFESNTFSVYGVIGTYTVDFHWEVDGKEYDFGFPGGGSVTFGQLVDVLGLASSYDGTEKEKTEVFLSQVETIEFSSPELLWLKKAEKETTAAELIEENQLDIRYSGELTEKQIEEMNAQTVSAGDWALIGLQPFDTQETLTVAMKTGEVFKIRVTDAQISTRYMSASGSLYDVTVIYGEDAEIPENSTLEVTEYAAGSEKYRSIRRAVLGDEEAASQAEPLETGEGSEQSPAAPEADPSENSESSEEEIETPAEKQPEEVSAEEPAPDVPENTEDTEETEEDPAEQEIVLEAFDISILDQDGRPVEPKAPVEVRIIMKELPSDIELFRETAAVQHLNTSSGELQVETVADTENAGEIYFSDNTAAADFTLDSFSQFAITYTQRVGWNDETRVTVNVHYVDTSGKELSGSTTGVNVTANQTLTLSSYQGRMNQSGYTYLGARYGVYSGQVITALRGPVNSNNSTGTLSDSGYIVEFLNGNQVVARQEYENAIRQVDVYLVYAPSSGYYIQDTIGEDGCLTVQTGTGVIQTGTDQNLFVKWYRSSSENSGYEEVKPSKILNGIYNIPVLGGPKVNVAIDEGADQYYKAEIYTVENNEERVIAETAPYHVPYYDDVRNGGFETPVNNGTINNDGAHKWPSNYQVENGKDGVIWKTTGTIPDKRDIEIPNGANADGPIPNYIGETLRNYCFAFMPEGDQCAELNCEASGALYQDVLTIPGTQMYWSLYHRARGAYDYWKTRTDKTQNRETDTMYVVAMSRDLAEKYDVTTQAKVREIMQHVGDQGSEFHDIEIVKITTTNQGTGTMTFWNGIEEVHVEVDPTYFGNLANGQTTTAYDSGTKLTFKYGNSDWHYYTGNFSIPNDQYLTRFFFVAGNTASENPTMGNFLDDIHLSDSVPAPNQGQATVIVQKTVKGLDSLPSNYATRIEASYTVTDFDGTYETVDKNSDYDMYRTRIDASGKPVSTASWTYPVFVERGKNLVFSKGEEKAPRNTANTDVVEGYAQTTSYILRKKSSSQSEPQVVAEGSGKVIPDADISKLTVNEKDVIYIEYINTYVPKYKVSVWKTDPAGRVISTGASFALYKAADYDDDAQKPRENAETVTSGRTGPDGILYLTELEAGDYRLVETDAPDGYTLFDEAVKITVTESGQVTALQGSSNAEIAVKGDEDWVEGQDDKTTQIRIWNNPGVELPATGGPGTGLYMISGLILTAGAGLLMKRRMAML